MITKKELQEQISELRKSLETLEKDNAWTMERLFKIEDPPKYKHSEIAYYFHDDKFVKIILLGNHLQMDENDYHHRYMYNFHDKEQQSRIDNSRHFHELTIREKDIIPTSLVDNN